MKILLTNDDGIHSPGLWAVYKKMKKKNQVTVVAPDREKSGVGHGISLHEPLVVQQMTMPDQFQAYAVNGTPVDCINLGIKVILGSPPDIVISGINPGINTGCDSNYSGTVAGAKEAAIFGIPAIAVSVKNRSAKNIEDYNFAASFINRLSEKVIKNGLPVGTFLNVNIPDISFTESSETEITYQNATPISDTERFVRNTDPRGRTYYWYGGPSNQENNHPGTERSALIKNKISITPLKCDATDHDIIQELKNWKLNPESGKTAKGK